MSDELKRRLVGGVVLLAVFSLVALWIGGRDQRAQELPSSEAVVRNYDVRELDRIAAAQQAEQAVAEPVDDAKAGEAGTQEEGVAVQETPGSGDAGSAEEAPPAAEETVKAPDPAPVRAPEPERAVSKPEESGAVAKPATDPKGGWIVQVASVTQQKNARDLAGRLKKSGWQSFVEEGVVNGTTYYRVRVGPYAGRGDADRAAAALKKELSQNVAVMSR